MNKKIMVVTTSRADYGLLYPLIQKIESSKLLDLKLVATGSHLSKFHGETVKLIEQSHDAKHLYKVAMTQEEDTEGSSCYSIAQGLRGFSELINTTSPDLLVVLGDRYELLSVCVAAVIHKIPIAHIHGGELSFGQIDDSIRHSITKMSSFHFASMEGYANRIVQMGENPSTVFSVGALGVDNIKSLSLMEKDELTNHLDIDFNENIALMTFHPVTLDSYESANNQIIELHKALKNSSLLTLMTMPNADTANISIYKEIKAFSKKYPEKFRLTKNLGQRVYLSSMKYATLMIGNSSSGIIEAASFQLPVVNIGDRQAGRSRSKKIIDCACSQEEKEKAIKKALSTEFLNKINDIKSPYGEGDTSKEIIEIIENLNLEKKSEILKKGFYDLEYDSHLEN